MKLLFYKNSLKSGQCIVLDRYVLHEAARANLSSLLFDSVRDSDIKEIVKKINRDKDFSISENMRGKFVLCKLA